MRGATRVSAFAFICLALGRPMPTFGQGLRPAEVVGVWRNPRVDWVEWDSATNTPSPHWSEVLLTLRADSTYSATAREPDESGGMRERTYDQLKWLGGNTGRWALLGDTLEIGTSETEPRTPGTPTPGVRCILARVGDTLTMQWVVTAQVPVGQRAQELEWVRIDTTKPLPTTLPLQTLTRTALVGTWVATSETADSKMVTDTVILRADSSWAASDSQMSAGRASLGGRRLGKQPQPPATTGTWYLGPANSILLVNTARHVQTGAVARWRGNTMVKLQGQQLIPQNFNYPIYTRVGGAAP